MRRSDVERLADIACELDALANFFPEPARLTIKHCVDELHATARACAERLGVTIYADDDEGEAVEAR
jgi:hypothetical protein